MSAFEESTEDVLDGFGEEEKEETNEEINEETSDETSGETGGEGIESGEGGSTEDEPDRQAETLRQQIITEEQRKSQDRLDGYIAKQYGGQLNPYTGNYITTEAELLNYQQNYEKEQQQEQLSTLGVQPEVLNKLIAENPAIKQAEAYVKEMEQQQVEEFAKTEMAELIKKFPDCGIKDLNDLEKVPKSKAILSMWGTGNVSLAEAYAAVNLDTVMGKKTAAAKQSAINSITGKGHLQRTTGGAGGEVVIPPDVLEEYRSFFPDWTDKKIMENYKNQIGG